MESRGESQERESRGGSINTGTQQDIIIEEIVESPPRNDLQQEHSIQEEDRVDTGVGGEEQHSINEEGQSHERDIIVSNPGTSQPNTSVPGTSQPSTSSRGPVSSPFLQMYLQGLASGDSDDEAENPASTESTDATLFQSARGSRKKPFKKIEGRAPWTR